MTKACIFRREKGDTITSNLTMFFFLCLVSGCAVFGSELPNMQEEAASLSSGSVQQIKENGFVLGPGDELEITVYRHADMAMTTQIENSGKIAYPLVGEIQAGGLSVSQLRNTLQAALAKYIVNPEVFINVSSVRSQMAIVLGEVNDPGLFSLDVPMTCLQIIASAGGFTRSAKQETILLIRGGLEEPELITLDFKRIFQKKDLTQNVSLRNGDIVYVPATRIENAARFFDHMQRILGTFYQAVFSGIIVSNSTQ
jgi:polysaccharide export outer membrane protein